MSDKKLQPLEISRRGGHPIYKYTIRLPGEWYSCIMIDEEVGNVLVNYDIHYFGYTWGKAGRGTETLREFLTTADAGYVADKFSYHLSRFNVDKVEKAWNEAIELAFNEGRLSENDRDILKDEFASDLIGECKTSSEYWSAIQSFTGYEERLLDKVFPEGMESYPTGQDYANVNVQRFVDRVWAPFQEFLRNELLTEARDKDAEELMDR